MLQIIFSVTNDKDDMRAKLVKHLMAFYEENDEFLIKQALDDWYLDNKKDYNVFASNYLLIGQLEYQGKKLEAMSNWCKAVGIAYTPTFFVNGFQLPQLYKIEDLNHLL